MVGIDEHIHATRAPMHNGLKFFVYNTGHTATRSAHISFTRRCAFKSSTLHSPHKAQFDFVYADRVQLI